MTLRRETLSGSVVTTRHFGGYERVEIKQVHDTYFVVSRFSGQATDILPRDEIEKVIRAGNGELTSGEKK